MIFVIHLFSLNEKPTPYPPPPESAHARALLTAIDEDFPGLPLTLYNVRKNRQICPLAANGEFVFIIARPPHQIAFHGLQQKGINHG